jgi:hypothetical protein
VIFAIGVANALNGAIAALAPIDGVAIGDRMKRRHGASISKRKATAEQRAAAEAALEAFVYADPVPTIAKAQALLWPLPQGKTEADIDSAIAAIPDAEQRAVAEIEWRYRQPFHYDHPLFAALAPGDRLAVDGLPAAFRAAAML